MKQNLQVFFLLLVLPFFTEAQSSTFDTDTEGWRASGDPRSTIPTYFLSGGNPGGYIRIEDDAVGGLWYFLPPPKFTGNRCDAYGKYMRFDQFTNDTMGQQGFASAWDIMIEGNNGLNVYFDHDTLPREDWTHYDILLREDAGWLLENTDLPPTEAQFRDILGDIDRIRILGEYHVGYDYGGMDNFVFESTYRLDLDADDSHSETGSWNYWRDSSCQSSFPIVDEDVLVLGNPVFSEIQIRLQPFGADADLEFLTINGTIPPSILASGDGTDIITLTNLGGASNVDFEAALLAIFFENTNPDGPASNTRSVQFVAKPDCGDGTVRAVSFLPIYETPSAGDDQTVFLCNDTLPFDMRGVLSSDAGKNGFWSPNFASNGFLFDPKTDNADTYRYITSGGQGCPTDTAFFEINIPRALDLGNDTLVCEGETFRLAPYLFGYSDWEWENGSQTLTRIILESGTYALQVEAGNCIFEDSITVQFSGCEECQIYAPNVFKPDQSGQNDNFRIFPSCMVRDFSLKIFDRWGSFLFESNDPEVPWFGFIKGKRAPSETYLWTVEFFTEIRGETLSVKDSGAVLLVR